MKNATKKRYLVPGIVLTILCILFLFVLIFAFFLRREINDIEKLGNYRVCYTDSVTDSADYLKQLCLGKLNIKLYNAKDSSHLFLRLIDNEAEAENYGISLKGIGEKGYLILRQGNTIYLSSKSKAGLNRACFALVYQLTDQANHLILALNEQLTDSGKNVCADILVGNLSLSEYSIVCPGTISTVPAWNLAYYINQSCGVTLPIADTSDTASIRLSIDDTLSDIPYSIQISEGNITITASDESSLRRGICLFADTYLGWLHAGTGSEKRGTGSSTLYIPANVNIGETPWIEEREAIVTLWNINYPRGGYYSNATSLKNDIMSFSEEQLYDYVRMLKYCGFTGIQATDMCSAWAGAGGYEYVQERLRMLADAAHSLDMKFTLWVWGSEFTGYGWVDNSVTYSSEGYQFAYENPDVIATFEKYYSIYAELADCCDRVIAHFYDPGNLVYAEDVAYFSNMLSEKFLSVNPNINFGVSCWVDVFDKSTLVKNLGNQITLYEHGHHDEVQDYNDFRNFCKNAGCRLGTWAWNTCEMEIDQLAQMNYNPHIIQNTYQTAMQYDSIAKPEYWSEMDSYHVLNVFSLYCAGHLLIDPYRSVDDLTYEVALAAVGNEYATEFAEVLNLLETARSGETWNTYWWNNEDYILKSENYPAEFIVKKCDEGILLLQEMIDKNISANTLPLPLDLREILQLMLPHLQQIRSFAEFRIEFDIAKEMAANGSSDEELQTYIDSIADIIPEYNAVIGQWGQIENRAKQELLYAFCQENNLAMPINSTFERECKFRIYSHFITTQKGKSQPAYIYAPYYQYGTAYGQDTTIRLVEELIAEGLLSRSETDGGVYLTNWEHYAYSFN